MGNVMDGKWKQIKGRVKQQWGKLTDDDLDKIEGNREELVGRIQEAYGKNRQEVEKEVNSFFDKLA